MKTKADIKIIYTAEELSLACEFDIDGHDITVSDIDIEDYWKEKDGDFIGIELINGRFEFDSRFELDCFIENIREWKLDCLQGEYEEAKYERELMREEW
jgi:hypothetical protein